MFYTFLYPLCLFVFFVFFCIFCLFRRLNQNLLNFRITFFRRFVRPLDLSVSVDSKEQIKKKEFGFGCGRRLSRQWNVPLNKKNILKTF